MGRGLLLLQSSNRGCCGASPFPLWEGTQAPKMAPTTSAPLVREKQRTFETFQPTPAIQMGDRDQQRTMGDPEIMR